MLENIIDKPLIFKQTKTLDIIMKDFYFMTDTEFGNLEKHSTNYVGDPKLIKCCYGMDGPDLDYTKNQFEFDRYLKAATVMREISFKQRINELGEFEYNYPIKLIEWIVDTDNERQFIKEVRLDIDDVKNTANGIMNIGWRATANPSQDYYYKQIQYSGGKLSFNGFVKTNGNTIFRDLNDFITNDLRLN